MHLATPKGQKKKPKKKQDILNVDGVDLPVTFNTNGRLDKKSQDAFDKIINRRLMEGTANRFNARDAVEIVGFGGLVALNYYGIDILGMFLGEAIKVVEEVVETVEDFNTVVTEKYGEAGVAITAVALATVPALVIGVGMPKVVVEDTVEETAIKAVASVETKIRANERTIQQLETGVLGRAIRREGGKIEVLDVQPRIDELKEENEKLKTLLDTEEVQTPILKDLAFKLKLKRVAISTGMAYIEKKFFESYEYSEAVENVPVVQ